MNNNGMNFDPNTGLPIVNDNVSAKKTNGFLKVLTIIGGVVAAIVVLFVVIFMFVSSNSNKLICKSSEGNITIMYNDSTIVGYTTTGLTYDMDAQKKIAEQIGIDEYISEFNTWFDNNTSGTCSVKKK